MCRISCSGVKVWDALNSFVIVLSNSLSGSFSHSSWYDTRMYCLLDVHFSMLLLKGHQVVLYDSCVANFGCFTVENSLKHGV